MKVHKMFDGWWLAKGGPGVVPHVVQVTVDDEYDLETTRPLQRTREAAEHICYHDYLPVYWEAGMAVWAKHCLGCGSFAKVLAFDDQYGWDWKVTECKKCGIIDSRTYTRS